MAAFGQDSPTMMANIERGNTMEGREIERLRARVAELERNGYVLAMRVAQSRLLAELDDTELSAMQAFVPALRGEEG